MNCFSAWLTRGCCLLAFVSPLGNSEAAPQPLEYDVSYTLTPDPATGIVHVELELTQPGFLLRELRMSIGARRLVEASGDGDVAVSNGRIRWTPPETGGSLRWTVHVAHRRNGDGYDAWLGPEWGIFRAEDVIARATTRTLRGARSKTVMRFDLPHGWSAVTEYFNRDGHFEIDRPERRFDDPTGWIVLGQLGVRRDTIGDARVAVAAPTGQSSRRLEALALLRWTLPELARIVPQMPKRLTIASAGEPMWRGALSAPASLFLHAERPLISENATSTLLHEVVHVATGFRSKAGFDWIVEGVAEYYSLELLYRSGTISGRRYESARRTLREWASSADSLCGESSSGATTALAVTTLADLDREIREKTGNQSSFDDVLAKLMQSGARLDLAVLRAAVSDTAGDGIETLHTDKLPGCSNITSEAN